MDIQHINIKDVSLDLENPRHEQYQSQDEVIEYLCKNEYIFALAQDIIEMGINPLESFALIPDTSGTSSERKFVVAEGNRRLCALKLLEDPELAPRDEQKNFKKLSALWFPLTTIPAIIFPDRESVADWLERIHGGTQGGIGRKAWSSEQKTRFTGDAKNIMAQQLLDYAQEKEMISAEQRNNKLSTVQRFISNPLLRDALGLDNSKNDEIQRTRPQKDFDLLLAKFMEDLASGEINTRFNAGDIKTYSQKLRNVEDVSNEVIPPSPLREKTTPATRKNSVKPTKPTKPRCLETDRETEKILVKLNNYKLQKLYHSLLSLSAAEHCTLITIGLWAFMESLTAMNGRNDSTPFAHYLSKQKLTSYGLNDKALKQSIDRLAENGNTSKHDQQAASFNDQQLINDFKCLHPLIQALGEEILSRKA